MAIHHASRAQADADAIVRAIEARRLRAPRAAALEDRIFSALFGDLAYSLTRAETDELETWTLVLATCGEGGTGDLEADAASRYVARLTVLEARNGLVVPEHVDDRP